jgi:hypothetical protein
MAASIYVGLTAEASSSCASTVDAPRHKQKSRACSQAVPSQRFHRRKPEGVDVPHKRSKRTKKATAKSASVAPSLHSGLLSGANFDQSKWEIMYLHFFRKVLLILLVVQTRKMFNLVCIQCNRLKFHFIHGVLCAIACVFLFCYVFTCFCRG